MGFNKMVKEAGRIMERGNPTVARRSSMMEGPDSKLKVESYKKGGKVKKTGLAYLHKGEKVIPKSVASAMREVHKNIPRNVVKTGKTGKAKEKMLEAIAFSKVRRNK